MDIRHIGKVTAVAVSAALLFCGCGNGGGGAASNSLEGTDLTPYITLGDYKGLTVHMEDATVSADDVEKEISASLQYKKTQETVTDRPVEEGDTVNIDFVGYKDGVAFEGGTGYGYDLDIGSGTFIPGFEEGLIGASIGDTVSVNVVFPDNYQEESLAGQPAVFDVTIHGISSNSIPELDDSLAKELDPEIATAEEYRAKVEKELKENKEESAETEAYEELLQQVEDNSTIVEGDKLPKWLVEQDAADQKKSLEASLISYGMDLNTYLSQQGMTEEEFDEQLKEYAEMLARTQILVQALANAENISISDEDLKKAYDEEAGNYGYENGEAFHKYLQEDGRESSFKGMLLARRVEEMLLKNANVVTD
ncbi:MAG: trigger factor [Lachnospiraceae bacterium]|nr:trigger factor [Lachnospiraceae bacterium]